MVLLLLVAVGAQAQKTIQQNLSFRQEVGYLVTKYGATLYRNCGFPTNPDTLNARGKGFLAVDTCGFKFGIWNGTSWQEVSGAAAGDYLDTFKISQPAAYRLVYTYGKNGVLVKDTVDYVAGAGGGGVDTFFYRLRRVPGVLKWVLDRSDRGDTLDLTDAITGGDSSFFEQIIDTTNIESFAIPYADTSGRFKADSALRFQPSTKTVITNNLYLYGTTDSQPGKLWLKVANPSGGQRPVVYAGLVPEDFGNGSIRFSGGGSSAQMEINSGDNNELLLHSPDGPMLFKQTDGLYRFYQVPNEISYNKMLVINDSGYVAWKAAADTSGIGSLFIRNQSTTQEAKAFNIRSGRLDSLYASGSGGVHFATNSGASAFEYGGGGGAQVTFNGFAGYNANRAASYTARSFPDVNYTDSSIAAVPTVTSYGKNAGGDSTILLLSNGQRFAAKDSTGAGGGSGVTTVGTFSGSSQTNGASISGSTITFGPADATNPGMVSIGAQTWAGNKTFSGLTTIGPGTYGGALSYKLQDSVSVVGHQYGEYHFLGRANQDFRIHFNGGTYLDNASQAALYLSPTSFIVRSPASFSSLTNTSFTNAIGSKLVFNGGTGTSQVGIGSGYNDFMFYVPSSNNFRWSNTGQYNETAASALMFLSASRLSTTVAANIGTYAAPPTSAIFSTTSTTKGSIPAPIMTATQRGAITSPASGLQVFNSTTSQPNYRDGSTWQAQVGMTFGTAAPTSTPTAVGNFFLDITNKKLYVATGTASSADWNILN